MRDFLKFAALALTWGGAAATWFVSADVWVYAIGAFAAGLALSIVVGIQERDLRPLLRAIIPAAIAGYYVVSNTDLVDTSSLGLDLDIGGETCRVSASQSMTNATTFDKPCSELTHADIYWTAGMRFNSNYWYEGNGHPPDGRNCRVGPTRTAIYDPNGTMYFSKPCSSITSADARAAGVGPGQTYYSWPWD